MFNYLYLFKCYVKGEQKIQNPPKKSVNGIRSRFHFFFSKKTEWSLNHDYNHEYNLWAFWVHGSGSFIIVPLYSACILSFSVKYGHFLGTRLRFSRFRCHFWSMNSLIMNPRFQPLRFRKNPRDIHNQWIHMTPKSWKSKANTWEVSSVIVREHLDIHNC